MVVTPIEYNLEQIWHLRESIVLGEINICKTFLSMIP